MKFRQSVWKGPALAALVLLPCHAALADNSAANVSVPSNQRQNPFHPNLYKFTAQHLEDKPFGAAVRENSGVQQSKPTEQIAPKQGLHWTLIDSHPGMGYQIDKNEELRLHFGGRGAKASYALRF